MVWTGMVRYGMVWYGIVWYYGTWYGMVWYSMVHAYGVKKDLPIMLRVLPNKRPTSTPCPSCYIATSIAKQTLNRQCGREKIKVAGGHGVVEGHMIRPTLAARRFGERQHSLFYRAAPRKRFACVYGMLCTQDQGHRHNTNNQTMSYVDVSHAGVNVVHDTWYMLAPCCGSTSNVKDTFDVACVDCNAVCTHRQVGQARHAHLMAHAVL